METVLFIHGMGTKIVEHAERYLELLRNLTSHKYVLLFYGDVFEQIPAYVVNWEPEEAISQWASPIDAYTDGFMDGAIENILNLGDEEGLIAAGSFNDVLTYVRNLYLHAGRYLLGREVYREVRDVTKRRFLELNEEHHFDPHSLILIGYSLGAVVSLDLLHDPDISHLFSRYISIGSPLGVLGMIPRIPLSDVTILTTEKRNVPVPWIDVATPNDPIAYKRVTDAPHFQGQGQPVKTITLPNWEQQANDASSSASVSSAHTSYFFDEYWARQWIEHINV